MTLPATGQLSMSSVSSELVHSSTSRINLGGTKPRQLAGAPTGAISLSTLRGKSYLVQTGLQINIDFSDPLSYPGSGTSFTNLVNGTRNNGYLKNNCQYEASNGGIIRTYGAQSGALYNVGDRIDINTSQGGIDRFDKTDNFSIFMWCRQTAASASKIFSTGSSGALTGDSDQCIWQFWMTSSGFYWWNAVGGGVAVDNLMTTQLGVSVHTPGVWQLVGFTYAYNEAGYDVVRCYTNASMVASHSLPVATHSTLSRRDTSILQYTLGGGYTSSCYNSNCDCRFGQFLVYNRTLSASEVSQNFNATRARFGV